MSLKNRKETYYCAECGVEMFHKGRVCADCSRDIKNINRGIRETMLISSYDDRDVLNEKPFKKVSGRK